MDWPWSFCQLSKDMVSDNVTYALLLLQRFTSRNSCFHQLQGCDISVASIHYQRSVYTLRRRVREFLLQLFCEDFNNTPPPETPPFTPSKRLVAVCAGHVALTFESEHQSTSYQQEGNLGPASPVSPSFVIYSTALASLGPPRSIPPPPPTSADLVGLISELLSPPSSTNSKQRESNNYNNDDSKGAAGEFQTVRISDGDSPPILVIKHGMNVYNFRISMMKLVLPSRYL